MKKVLKRGLSLLLAITIIFGSMYIGLSEVDFGGLFVVKAEAASIVDNATFSTRLNDVKSRFKQGEYFSGNYQKGYNLTKTSPTLLCTGTNAAGTTCTSKGYCGYYGWCTCKCGTYYYGVYEKCWQCWAFACQVGYDIFGVDSFGGWNKHRSATNIKAGDIVRFNWTNDPNNSQPHSVFVLKVENGTVYYADCNASGPCKVDWNKSMSVSRIQTLLNNRTESEYAVYHAPNSAVSANPNTPTVPLTTPTITFSKSSYTEGDTISLSWTASPADSNLSHYWVRVTDSNGNVYVNNRVDKPTTSYSFITPGVGTFQVTTSATPIGSVSGEGSLTNTKSITVNAKISTYTVSYNANGGTGAPSAQTKYQNTALTLSSTKPTRSGYTFLGWSTSSTATSATYVAGGSYTANSGATLYAVWRINTYTVSYNANGGTGAPGSVSHSHGSTHTISSTIPERFGYIFKGWGTSSNASTIYSSGQNYTVTGNTTFYAQWASAYGATLNSTHTAKISEAGAYEYYKFEPSFTLNYCFESTGSIDSIIRLYDSTGAELAYNDDGGNDFNFLLNCTLQGGQTYYIKVYAYSNNTGNIPFTIKGICEVAYNANGGTDAPTSQVTFTGESIYLATTAPRRCGYTFIGWAESPDATAPQYQPGDVFSASNNNVTLYAVWEASTMADYLEYELWDGGIEITDCDDTYEGELVIPSTIDGYPVTSIENYAFENCNKITSIIIPNGVTSIGWGAFEYCTSLVTITIPHSVTNIKSSAFYGCTSLTSITIPDSVTSIDGFTFYGCTSLASITIPDSVTSIGNYAFYGCNSLMSIDIPDRVTSIGEYAFYKCTSLTTFVIPDSVTSIGDWIFAYCNSLTTVTIGNGVTNIGRSAFEYCTSLITATIGNNITSIGVCAFCGCKNLSSITIPDGVTTIGISAFAECASLTFINIPNSVTSIDSSAFNSCTGLVSINVDENNESYSSVDGVLFNKAQTELIKYPCRITNTSYTIPNSVTSICKSAFIDCTNLTSITIPVGVTNIGDSAFVRCTSLISVAIPDGVTCINRDTFYGCTSLASVTFSESVTNIGDFAFAGCTSLTSITIPASVTSIDSSAFSGCTSLTTITADSANEYYCSIDGVLFNKDKTELVKYPSGKRNTSYIIPDSVTSILERAFNGCESLTSVIIPESVTTIGRSAFSNCKCFTSITIPESVTIIDSYAFDSCPTLTSVTIGNIEPSNTVTSIGSYAFERCTSLTSVIIGSNVASIGSGAFTRCEKLTSIRILNGVNSISSHAFSYCSSLTSINIPNSVTSIGNDAFLGCTSLTSVIIPNSITRINLETFASCKNLTSIIIPDGVTIIGDSAFRTCKNLTSVIIPDSVTSINYQAFDECNSLGYIFYSGTEEEWSNITIEDENTAVEKAIIHYNSTDHSYGDWVIDAEPSCAVAGHKHRVCSVCNYTDNVEIEATNAHEYSDWVVITPPSCVENGLHSKSCFVCGSEYTEEFSGTGHLNTMWITEQEPNCTVAGYKDEWCLDCGEMVGTEEIPATGHQSTMWIIELYPTCVEVGYKDEWCLDCGEIASTEEIPANGHDYSTEWTIDVAATCTEEGSKSHHCMVCDDKGDVTVIASLGHDFKVVSVDEEHPHTISYKCSRCTETKQETSTSATCGICNFTYTNVDAATCRITGYIGSEAAMIIPATIDGRTVATTTTGAFKNNTTLTSVRIENGVQGIGALAFLGCSSLSKVVIPESVTSIGANAFYNCASDFTLYCYSGSYAEQYAIDNSLNYVVMDIGETENCTIDYANELIYVSIAGLTSLDDIIYVPTNSMVFTEASLVSGSYEFLGTGSIITVFDGNDISSEYTLVVEGDVNGDSVCDVLDAMHVALVSNGHRTLDGAYAMAADSNSDDIVDVTDYQSIVNKAVS